VPEAEPAVGRWQRQHTRAGADGMPPHVTLLIPFADSESLPLAVLWLAPEPAALSNNVSFVHRVGGRWALHSTLALRDP
jgi:hypothetical protein